MNFNSNNSNKNEMNQNIDLNRADSVNNSNKSMSKKNTIEYDTFFSKDISMNSQDIKNKYNEIDNKNTIPLDTIENNTNKTYSLSNTLKGSLNRPIYTSKKSYEESVLSKQRQSSIFSNENLAKASSIKNSINAVRINDKNLKLLKQLIDTKLITRYKYWKGNNYFPFEAHFLEGPCSFRPTLATWCAITVPYLLFLIFDSKYISEELTVFIPILIGIIYLISCVYLIYASFCDPGIIRRFNLINDNKAKDYIKKIPENIYITRKEIKFFHLGYIKVYRYCPSCGIIRPNRSTHCNDCNNCVERLDHHCPWIGNCVGKRNYPHFFIFLSLMNLQSILIAIFCIVHIVLKVKDYSDWNKQLPEEAKIKHVKAYAFCEVIVSLYLIVFSAITMCFITGLIFYHCRLIFINSTTKEELRKLFYNNYGNPYRKSICQNIKSVFCPKIKKHSILDILRGDIKEICDKNNMNKKPFPSYEEFPTNIDENETNIKLNLEPSIVEDLNNKFIKQENNINSADKYKEYIISDNNYNYKVKKEIDNSEIVLNEENMNELNDNDIELKQNKSFKISNDQLEDYLKTFGTGIPSFKSNSNPERLDKFNNLQKYWNNYK